MATTETLSTLKINYLTQAQYDDALANNNINANELYFTPSGGSNNIQTDFTVEGKTYLNDTATITDATLGTLTVTGPTSLAGGLNIGNATDSSSWTDVWVNQGGWVYKRSKTAIAADLAAAASGTSSGVSSINVTAGSFSAVSGGTGEVTVYVPNNTNQLTNGAGFVTSSGSVASSTNATNSTYCTTTADTSNTLYLVGVTSGATTTLKRNTSITMAGSTFKVNGMDYTITSSQFSSMTTALNAL